MSNKYDSNIVEHEFSKFYEHISEVISTKEDHVMLAEFLINMANEEFDIAIEYEEDENQYDPD